MYVWWRRTLLSLLVFDCRDTIRQDFLGSWMNIATFITPKSVCQYLVQWGAKYDLLAKRYPTKKGFHFSAPINWTLDLGTNYETLVYSELTARKLVACTGGYIGHFTSGSVSNKAPILEKCVSPIILLKWQLVFHVHRWYHRTRVRSFWVLKLIQS